MFEALQCMESSKRAPAVVHMAVAISTTTHKRNEYSGYVFFMNVSVFVCH